MYTDFSPGGLGQVTFGGPGFTPSPSGNQCFHGWYFAEMWRKPSGITLLNHLTMTGYAILGWMCGMEARQNIIGNTGNWRTHPLPDQFMVAVVGKQVTHTVHDVVPEGEPHAGLPRTRNYVEGSPAAQALSDMFSGGPASGGVLTICGPIFTAPDGTPYVVVEQFQKGPDPAATARPIIEVEGLLTEWSPPGISQVWPKVGSRVVSSSAGEPGSISFGAAWNAGELALGSKIYIRGHDDDVRGAPGVVPIEWRLVEAGEGPAAGGDKPGTVDLPEELPPPREPDPDDPDTDDDGWIEDTDDTDWTGDGTTTGTRPGGNGTTTPGGNGTTTPGGNGGPGVLEAGFGGKTGLVVLSLLLVPFFLSKDRK